MLANIGSEYQREAVAAARAGRFARFDDVAATHGDDEST
jgi:hypothetical protein